MGALKVKFLILTSPAWNPFNMIRLKKLGLAICAVFMNFSAISSELPAGFSKLKDVAPNIIQDMRYYGSHNFTGNPVPGYKIPECWLKTEAAQALKDAQQEAEALGLKLVVFDCYRPQRAVLSFMKWAANDNNKTKKEFYPKLEKQNLFQQGYIAEKSMHSTGLAVDIGINGLNFGTPFDYFGQESWTKNSRTSQVTKNRNLLSDLLRKHNFVNYPREWWHFTYQTTEVAPAYDVEIE